MLVTWLVELFLTSLGKLKDRGLDETSEYDTIQDKFRDFMAYPRIKVSEAARLCHCPMNLRFTEILAVRFPRFES